MTIQQLKPITIARGASINPSFRFVNQDNTIPDFSNFEGYYVLSPYGFEDENVYSVLMNRDDINKFTATLDTLDTKDFDEGTYTAKVILVDEDGNQYKYARGVFNVLKDTAEVGVTT